MSFEFLDVMAAYVSELHHGVSISLSLADKLWRTVAYFVSPPPPPALCSFLVTLIESVFSVYKLILRGGVGF